MDTRIFKPGFPGKLLRIGKGDAAYTAFVPSALPPTIEWTPRLVQSLSRADLAIGQLAGVGRTLPNPHLLIGTYIRREAVLSSRIEGTQSSLSDLVLFEAFPDPTSLPEDAGEVANYVRAMEVGLRRIESLPLSQRLIRELHAVLLKGVRGHEKTPGEFRRTQNWIGRPGSTIATAAYVPPPPDEIPNAIGSLEKFIHQSGNLPSLVRLALIHYQFEAIHPFLDGNGRVGRLLITLILCAEGVLPGPLLYLSAYFEKRRTEYYAGLLAVSQRGAWSEWIEYFLEGVSEQAADAVARASQLLKLRDSYRRELQKLKAPTLPLRLVEELFSQPAVTVNVVASLLEVTHRSAQLVLAKLEKAGIVNEVSGRKRNRVFLAQQIVAVIQ